MTTLDLIGLLDQVIQSVQDLLRTIVIAGTAVDAEAVGEQDHAFSSGEVAQTANDETCSADRASREAGLNEFIEAVRYSLLFGLILGLVRIHLFRATRIGEGRHHVAAERIPDQLLDSGVKNAFVTGELLQHSQS